MRSWLPSLCNLATLGEVTLALLRSALLASLAEALALLNGQSALASLLEAVLALPDSACEVASLDIHSILALALLEKWAFALAPLKAIPDSIALRSELLEQLC